MNIPLYSDLARSLRERILNGQFLPGSRLPSERDLCEKFSASRITIRQALSVLEKEQLLVRIHGSGTYVSDKPRLNIPVESNFTLSMQEHAPDLKRKLISHTNRPATQDEARILKTVEHAPILVAERIYMIKWHVTAWDTVLIPQAYAAGIGKRILTEVNFLELWSEKCNLQISLCEQHIRAQPATEQDIELLCIDSRTPILCTQEVYMLDSSRPAGAFRTHYNSLLVGIRSEFPIQNNPHRLQWK